MICKTQASLSGALLLLISISSFAMSWIKHIVKTATSTDSFSLCLSLVMFVIAILLIGAGNKSVYELFTQSLVGSQFVNSAMGIRVLDEEKNDVYQKETSSSPKTFAVILFCLLICGISLWAGLERIVLISLVSCFVIAVLKMPESGIMMLLVAFPWIGLFENDELILAAISLLILFSWMFKLSIGKRVYSFCFVDIAVLAFFAIFLLFGINSISANGNLNEVWCYFFVGLLYFPITGLVRSSEWISRCMRAYTLGTLIVSFVGISQFAVMCLAHGYRGFLGVTSGFENNHTLCAYLLVGIYIGLFNFLERYELKRNLSYDVSLTLNIICLILSGSKTAYLALLVSFLIFLLVRKPKVLALLLLLIPFVVVVMAIMPEAVIEGLSNVIESSDVGIRSKLQLWSNILENTKDYLFFGIGTDPSALEAVWDDCTNYLQSPAQMYNLYLSIFVKTGVVGIVIFGAMVVSTVQRGFFVFFGDQSGSYFKNLSVCTMSSFVSLMVFGMGDSLLYDINLFLLIFLRLL